MIVQVLESGRILAIIREQQENMGNDMEKEQMTTIRQQAKKRFADYTAHYDMAQPKIALKAVHTYHVAELCERIARDIGLNEEDILVAWMCGLLHDIGRFEQIRRFNTFSDADSIDHALLSIQILFGDEEQAGRIREFMPEDDYDELIDTAIRYHSAYRLPENISERQKMFCDILRDADKIDIFRVNLETPMEDIYNTTTEELRNATVTPEVLQAFYEHHAVLRSLKKTPVDHVVGHISLFYELVYPISKRIALEQGYLGRLTEFVSDNPDTQQVFAQIRNELRTGQDV